MITISRKTFHALCAALGISAAKSMEAVVAENGETLVVDDKHDSFPKRRGCGCCGQPKRNKK